MLSRSTRLARQSARRTLPIVRAQRLPAFSVTELPLSALIRNNAELGSSRSFSALSGGLSKKFDIRKADKAWHNQTPEEERKKGGPTRTDDVEFQNQTSNSARERSTGQFRDEPSTESQIPVEESQPSPSLPEQFNLPDLTKGIPPTLAQELEAIEKENRINEETDNAPNLPHSSARPKREPESTSKSQYISSADRRRQQVATLMYASLILLALTGTVYLGRNWETEEEQKTHSDAPDGWGLSLFWGRVKARTKEFFDYYNEPAFPKLLPDPDPQWERPYTLVLSLEDLLIHSEWTRENGWRTAKRPGVDYFLTYLSQYYELVVFTSLPSHIADPILKKLDPFRFIMWPLFREATRYRKGEYIKVLLD
jgi:import inner membrane translocase subunit TIM50